MYSLMLGKFWHVPQNSFYLEIVKIRYQGKEYFKANVRYFTKASGLLIAEEKNVKIYYKVTKFWEIWDE